MLSSSLPVCCTDGTVLQCPTRQLGEVVATTIRGAVLLTSPGAPYQPCCPVHAARSGEGIDQAVTTIPSEKISPHLVPRIHPAVQCKQPDLVAVVASRGARPAISGKLEIIHPFLHALVGLFVCVILEGEALGQT